jgi:hypothetical protein
MNRQYDTPYAIDLVDLKKLARELSAEHARAERERDELRARADALQADVDQRSAALESEARAKGLVFRGHAWVPPPKAAARKALDFSDAPHLRAQETILHLQVENKHLRSVAQRLREQKHGALAGALGSLGGAVSCSSLGHSASASSLGRHAAATAAESSGGISAPTDADAALRADIAALRLRIDTQRAQFEAANEEHAAVCSELLGMNEEQVRRIERAEIAIEQVAATIKHLTDRRMRLEAKCAALAAVAAQKQ